MSSRTRTFPVLLVVVLLALVASGCGLSGSGPDDRLRTAVSRLAHLLEVRDVSGLGFTEPGAGAAANALIKPLRFPTDIRYDRIVQSGATATARLRWTVTPYGQDWKHDTEVTLKRSGADWKIVWKSSIVESSLTDAESLTVTGIKAARGNILGANGTPLVEPRAVVRFGIDKARVPAAAVPASAQRLAAALGISPAPLLKAVRKAGPKAFVPALVLRRKDASNALLGRVAAIPGARAISDHLPLATSKDFAAALLGTVGPVTAELVKASDGRLEPGDDAGLSGLQLRYDEQLAGTPGAVIRATPAKGTSGESRVLFTAAPVAGEPLRLTLDLALQQTAQRLLTRYGPASALVAIKPSTGQVLAAASGPGSNGYNTATFAQYAPGSTFKVISSLALLRSGLRPTSTITCPATVSVTGKVFKNYSDYPTGRLGSISLRDAVANSCNTAFIGQRDRIKPGALAAAAAALGVGIDRDLGFPAYFGQVPAARSETEAAADLIGQGKILASPLAMATVVASVVKGSTVVPHLVAGVEPAPSGVAVPLTAREAADLRLLMHAVVTDGSGALLQALQPPQVLAKTGTAEYGTPSGSGALPTHAWMIAARGDLAVAVFVADGQSGSRTAGPVLADFLRAAGKGRG